MAQTLGFVALIALFFHPSPSLSAFSGLRLAKHEHLQSAPQNGHFKENTQTIKLSSSDGLVAEVQPFIEDYIVKLSIGNPPVPFMAFPSTVSDFTWTQCKPCVHCFNQTTPIYDPSRSSSFSKIRCDQTRFQASQAFKCTQDGHYIKEYLTTSTEGVLGTETFTFGSTSVHGIVFGCGASNTFNVPHGSGIIGLGRGPLSLVSQLSIKKFSYCLSALGDSNGRLFLGSQADFDKNLKIVPQSTPLLQNTFDSSSYYLSLKGITVGATRLPISIDKFQVKENGTGGIIISTGTLFPTLEKTTFELVKQEFRSQLGLPFADGSSVGYDVCFSWPQNSNMKVPKMIYNFQDADLDLPVNNYLTLFSSKNLLCLMIFQSNDERSTFGSIHQQNIHILYDLEKEMLSFAPTKCGHI